MKAGDLVTVINKGKQYSLYDKWAKAVGATKWLSGEDLEDGDFGWIVTIRKHLSDSNILLALIRVRDKEFIIGINGLRLSANCLEKQIEFEVMRLKGGKNA